MSSQHLPRFRLAKGRPLGENKSLDMGGAQRMLGLRVPLDLFQEMVDDLRDPEVGFALSGLQEGYASDYIRASILLLHLLLNAPTRERVLAFLNLPESRLSNDILAHLAFRFAEPQTPEHADLYRQGQGVSPVPEGEAPLDDATPWNQV